MAVISVLCVDDDEDEFVILADMFKQMRSLTEDDVLELTWVKDFTEGLRRYISGKFDVCLLDYHLGVKNAHEFLWCVRLYMNQAPIIVLTHHNEFSLDVGLMECGVRAFLPKSDITPISLERTIRHVLGEFKHTGMEGYISQHWKVAANKNILCVEDDPDDYEILRHNLSDIKTTNYHSTHVTNLQAATQQYLGNNHYDACLLDYDLGADCGLDILHELGENINRTPIIMLTNYDDPSLDRISMELGISGLLLKSYATTEKLERMLRYAIHYADKVVLR